MIKTIARIQFFAILTSLVFSGCKKDEIGVYETSEPAKVAGAVVPAGHPPMGQLPPALAARAADAKVSFSWETPRGWVEKPGSGMRQATFFIGAGAGQLEMSVISLPGRAGGVLPNVNRWRRQLGLDEVKEDGLGKVISKVVSPAGEIVVVDLTGAKLGMLSAILNAGEESWFFKMVGPPKRLAEVKPEYMKFLKSVRRQG